METGLIQAAAEPSEIVGSRTAAKAGAAPGARWLRRLGVACVAAFVAACGGGGGGSSGGAGTGTGTGTAGSGGTITVFPLQAAYRAYTVTGSSRQFAVSGDCTGTATLRSDAPVAAAFEGAAALAVSSSSSFSLPGCGTQPAAAVNVEYFDSAYRLLGTSVPGIRYGVYDAAVALPAFVSAGDSGTLGTQLFYTDATRSVAAGKAVLSYAIAADTATTLLARFITTTYDAAGRPLRVETLTYRLGADGSFGLANLPILFSIENLNLVLTPQ